MKKKLLIIVIVIAVICIIIGTVPTSFQNIKYAIESIKASSYDLTMDISTITLIYFTISDFSHHADGIELRFYYRIDPYGNPTGESGWTYRSYEIVIDDIFGEVQDEMRNELITVTPSGWEGSGDFTGASIFEMQEKCERAIAPVRELIEFDRSEEEEWGFFERIFNNIRLGVLTIKTVISAIIVTIVDTVGLVWEFISAGFKIIGVSS